jgi:hypothetical protein
MHPDARQRAWRPPGARLTRDARAAAQFGTTFEMMNAEERRGQTTKGVWISKSPKIDAPATLVMDLEGSDSRERGEDDTNFERQSALFALAVADTLIINLWNSDIGREHGSGKPLMKTIMQVRAAGARSARGGRARLAGRARLIRRRP